MKGHYGPAEEWPAPGSGDRAKHLRLTLGELGARTSQRGFARELGQHWMLYRNYEIKNYWPTNEEDLRAGIANLTVVRRWRLDPEAIFRWFKSAEGEAPRDPREPQDSPPPKGKLRATRESKTPPGGVRIGDSIRETARGTLSTDQVRALLESLAAQEDMKSIKATIRGMLALLPPASREATNVCKDGKRAVRLSYHLALHRQAARAWRPRRTG